MSTEITTIIGIDLSITSPGVTVYETKKKLLNVYYYSKLKRDKNRTFKKQCLQTPLGEIIFHAQPFGTFQLHKIQDYYARVTIILKDILTLVKNPKTTRVFIEGYAFAADGANSYKLYGIGEILRYNLWLQKIEFINVPPTSLKKSFCGKGNADKMMMYQAFIKKGFPNLLTEFETKIGNSGLIPNPIQDIVDSVALVMYTKPNKKRKRDP